MENPNNNEQSSSVNNNQPPVTPQPPVQPNDTTVASNNQQFPVMSIPPTSNSTSVPAIVGFILAFIVPLAGLIVSIVALVGLKKNMKKGKGLSIAGIIVSAFMTIFTTLIIMMFVGIFAFLSLGSTPYVGKWDCGNDYGMAMDDDGNYAGNDYENMTLSRHYEFGLDGSFYLYPIDPEDPASQSVDENYLRGSYEISSTEEETSGAVEYYMDITVEEYLAGGEVQADSVGEVMETSVIGDTEDSDKLYIYSYSSGTNAYMCYRAE